MVDPQDTNTSTVLFAIKGFSWNVLGNLIRSLAGFAINILLARLLGPEPFGVVALALLIIGIGNLLIESGLGATLIQKREVSEEDIAFVFTLQMGFSILLSGLVIGLAPWLSKQFSTPAATPVLRVMSLMLIFQAFAQMPAALLRRVLDFKRLQIAQITSFFVGFLGVGIPMAWAGMGAWSLVAAQVLQSGLNALMLYLFARHSLTPTLKGSYRLLSFGVRVLAANIANWLIQYLDQVIVGRQFGPQNLGYYNRAYFLGSTPSTIVLSSAQSSLFSAVSRMGATPETRRFFRNTMNFFAIVSFPAYWLVALEAPTIIKIIYGPKWLPAASLLTPLAAAFPIFMLMGLQGPVLNGLGRPGAETKAQWVTVLFSLVVLWIASAISLTAIAWGIVVISTFRFFLLSYASAQTLKVPWKETLSPFGIGAFLGGLTILLWLLDAQIVPSDFHPALASLVRVSGVLLTLSILAWIKRAWLKENIHFSPLLSPTSLE